MLTCVFRCLLIKSNSESDWLTLKFFLQRIKLYLSGSLKDEGTLRDTGGNNLDQHLWEIVASWGAKAVTDPHKQEKIETTWGGEQLFSSNSAEFPATTTQCLQEGACAAHSWMRMAPLLPLGPKKKQNKKQKVSKIPVPWNRQEHILLTHFSPLGVYSASSFFQKSPKADVPFSRR